MKRVLLVCCLIGGAFGLAAETAYAQEKPKSSGQELDANPLTDALLEVDAKKNLKAAQLYFSRNKNKHDNSKDWHHRRQRPLSNAGIERR